MVKALGYSLLIWLWLIVPVFAGTITKIDVLKNTKAYIDVMIKGQYDSYQAVMSQSPFRFVIDLDNTSLSKGLPRTMRIKSPIVSRIESGTKDKGLRIVFYSARPDVAFHTNIQDKQGCLIVRCWKEAVSSTRVKTKRKDSNIKKLSHKQRVNYARILPKKRLEDIIGRVTANEVKDVKKDPDKISTYSNKKVSLDFYKTDLHNVFRVFSEVSGKNIIVDQDVQGKLTMALKDVPWDFAMELILDVEKLQKTERLNTIIISKRPEKKGEKGALLIRKVSNDVIQPAKRLKQREAQRQQAEKLILKASNLENRGNRQLALQAYEKAVWLWKDNIDLLKKVGYLHYVLGNFSKSYYFSKRALRLNTKDAEAAQYAALAAARMGKDAEADVLFKTAVQGEPKIPEAFYNYGLFLEKHKRYNKAITLYKKDEVLFGPSLKLSLRIARLYEKMGNMNAACEEYRLIQVSGFDMDESVMHRIKLKTHLLCE